MNSVTIRDILLDEISKEVVGPYEDDEILSKDNPPQSKYLSGILYPIQTKVSEDMQNMSAQISSSDDDSDDEKIPIHVGTQPSSMGLTCNIPIEQKSVMAEISYGRYAEYINDADNSLAKPPSEKNDSSHDTAKKKSARGRSDWKRTVPDLKPIEIDLTKPPGDPMELEPHIFLRYHTSRRREGNYLTLSVFLTNEERVAEDQFDLDKTCIFQPKIKLYSPDSSKIFLSASKISKKKIASANDSDRKTLFLFRKFKHFAQGHSCSAEWDVNETDDRTAWVQTTFIPQYSVPEIKPREPTVAEKKSLNMKHLSKVANYADYADILNPIISEYKKWIDSLESERQSWKSASGAHAESRFVSADYDIPKETVDECRDALERIQEGIDKVSKDRLAGESFRFVNEVMYENITHSAWIKTNRAKLSNGDKIMEDGPNPESEPEWRLFQMAFLLSCIESIMNPDSKNRNNVDLLWFPTGSGKTEAYYGVIAFTMAYRRLKGKNAASREEELDRYGVSVIMRYTYRLLTQQQFQRAATLFCALEYVRMKNQRNRKNFGSEPFLVGLWVGSSTTPNSFDEAKKLIQKMRSGASKDTASNPIQLLNCPWCGRRLRPHNYKFEPLECSADKLRPRRIWIHCDKKCFFGNPHDPDHTLPVVFIDEDVRNLRPSLLIATVDKFAQISWNWRYSTLFGNVSQYCREHGYRPGNASFSSNKRCRHNSKDSAGATTLINITRNLAPPELIIQDELHLIAGPLGTLTGLYETAIDILCANPSTGSKPKIIASTATTKKSSMQIDALFGSKSTKIFPPQGFEFGDSHFAKVMQISKEHPGKTYVGICTTARGHDADARIPACVLRKIRHIGENKNAFHFRGQDLSFTDDDLDPYHTVVAYYNTIKNLGAATRMYEDAVPRCMDIIIETLEKKYQARNSEKKNSSVMLNREELTGRIEAARVPGILKSVEAKRGSEDALDVLLCTNMLSVGVDVDRLNLMIHSSGQPKSTSEYIQASGRIGRKNPGIILVNYNYMRPRDLSYFENFIEFHSTYHKSIESSTLTPFSKRARDRGLAGVFLALARLTSMDLSSDPKMFDTSNTRIKNMIDSITKQILERICKINDQESEDSKEDIGRIVKKWEDAVENFRKQSSAGSAGLEYRRIPYKFKQKPNVEYLLNSSRDAYNEHAFTIPESLREAESEISLYYAGNYTK